MATSYQAHLYDNHSHMPQLNIYCINCKREMSFSHLNNVLGSTGYFLTLKVRKNISWNLYRMMLIKFQYNWWCDCLVPSKIIEEWVLEEQLFIDYKAAASTEWNVRKDFIFLVLGSFIKDIISLCILYNLDSKCLSWSRGSVIVHELK